MQIAALLRLRLHFCYWNAVRVGKGVMPYTGDLPGDPATGPSAGYFEAIVGDFPRDVQTGRGRADRGQLIAEVAVQGFEVIRQIHPRLTFGVQADHAVVDVHHVGTLDKGV